MPIKPESGKSITEVHQEVNDAFGFWTQNTEIFKTAKNIGDVLLIMENMSAEELTEIVGYVSPITGLVGDSERIEMEAV